MGNGGSGSAGACGSAEGGPGVGWAAARSGGVGSAEKHGTRNEEAKRRKGDEEKTIVEKGQKRRRGVEDK